MTFGTVVLGICYAIAFNLGHVHGWTDISGLVVHLPERILFRVNFSICGGLLAALAMPIHDVAAARVGGKSQSTLTKPCSNPDQTLSQGRMPAIGAFCQLISGLGLILVGACGPEEILDLHVFAAILGMGGSGIAQVIYGIIFFKEDHRAMPDSARRIFLVRCFISVLFFTCMSCCLLGNLPRERPVLPEPWGHVFEWGMWFTLLGWYFTFRWDLSRFCLATGSKETSTSIRQL